MTDTKRFRVPEMQGAAARWYARQRGSRSQLEAYRTQAALLTTGLPPGAEVLEIAPGPGYLAIEMARLGRVQVTDTSRTFDRWLGSSSACNGSLPASRPSSVSE